MSAVPSDLREFADGIRSGSVTAAANFLAPGSPVSVARAPGRLDVMGGIADYSGSLVLQLPIREATLAAAQRADGEVRVRSVAGTGNAPVREVGLGPTEWAALLKSPYDVARRRFRDEAASGWAAYVVGVLLVLARERGVNLAGGVRLLVRSHVPEGKGVSSSAALEVAAIQAVARLLDVALEGEELARLCQTAENYVVGAPCGIMDQMTAALGRADHLLVLLCQPAEVQGFLPIPPGVAFWGIDSGIRHAVSSSDYGAVRTGAFMGYRILADLAGHQPARMGADGVLHFDNPPWGGYLANLTPGEFATRFAEALPQEMAGEEFLRRYGGTTDPVTRVAPERTYAVRQPTAHPIHEHARVRRFARLLAGPVDESAPGEMGRLMYESHASYSTCDLGSAGTDRLVELVRQAGPAAGLYGAKITGGGSGGTVTVLGRAGADAAVRDIARRYGDETGRKPYVFSGSSPGACLAGDP